MKKTIILLVIISLGVMTQAQTTTSVSSNAITTSGTVLFSDGGGFIQGYSYHSQREQNSFTPDTSGIEKVEEQLTDEQFMNELNAMVDISYGEGYVEDTYSTYLLDSLKAINNRLKKLGFIRTGTNEAYQEELRNYNKFKVNLETKREDKLAHDYFKTFYPDNLFLSYNLIKHICNKYILSFGEVTQYTGDVPLDKLKEIEDFKVKRLDVCYERGLFAWGDKEYVNCDQKKNREGYFESDLFMISEMGDFSRTKDPIVLHPVVYDNKRYFLVVTNW